MAARVYCAVLLCLSGWWSSTEAAPGQNFTANPGVSNNEKCCSKGCGPQCMPPVKPGVCPRGKLEPEVCALIRFASCGDDSDCADTEKCCYNGCGLQCMPPYTANPGVCPSRTSDSGPKMCPGKPFDMCVDDSDCTNNEKCCSNGCGLQLKPGVCPWTNYEEIICKKEGLVLCADDSKCPKSEKCCNTACGGRQCTAPVTVKPGVCPSRNDGLLIKCIKKDKALCADDRKCPKNEKCCSTACGGTRCTAPVTVKPGVCPITNHEVIRCVMKDKELCADDSKCPKKEKCCSTACGGTRCTAPVTVKPGVCPRKNNEDIRCVMNEVLCASDSECPKKEKCCSTACGGRCTAPVTANPGVCPIIKYDAKKCIIKGLKSCVDDSECPTKMKCCSNGCGRHDCMVPDFLPY